MFANIIEGPFDKAPAIVIRGQVQATLRLIGERNPIVQEAMRAANRFCLSDSRLTKIGLLELWKDNRLSFGSKCLVTFWWGRPNHLVMNKVYTERNLDKLSSSSMEQAFCSLQKCSDFDLFKKGLEALFNDFQRTGRFYLNGIGVSFYTKLFHFFFASHPPLSNSHYLPPIADDVLRSAVYAEMIDQGENVLDIFNPRNASLKTYVGFSDRFNEYAIDLGINPFCLEDILFNRSKGLGKAYVSGYNGRICLPHWIAGRYNEENKCAIVFNNLVGETYLFEGPTAVLWRELLSSDYEKGLVMEDLCLRCGCGRFDLISFFKELIDKKILVDHTLNEAELDTVKRSVNKKKRSFLRSVKGVGNFHSIFESVDNDYKNRITPLGIPISASIELTYACNEACIHCYNPKSPREGGSGVKKLKPTGELSAKEYFPILDDMKRMGVAKIVFTGGDPFTKKDFMSIIGYAQKLKFAFSVYTNGQALYADPKLYDELRALYPQYVGLSLYSTLPNVHDSITRRKGSCEITKTVAQWCFRDAIGLQIKCPIMKQNMDSYGSVFDFALSVNGMPQLDVNITSSIDGDDYASQFLRLSKDQLMAVLKDPRIPLSIENGVGSVERKPDMMFCGAGESSFNLQPDGTVTPCCAFPMKCGNVKDKSIDVIFSNSDNLYKIRNLRYKDSDLCGGENYCKYCNRCPGQSFVEHGVPENHCVDNCFLAKIRHLLATQQETLRS